MGNKSRGKSDTKNTVPIIVAIISAVALIIATLIPELFKLKTPPTPIVPLSLTKDTIVITPKTPADFLLPTSSPTSSHTPFPTIPPTPDNSVPMVLVNAGTFYMGSDIGSSDEKPTHLVDLDGFYIDKYEVTNAFYKLCADEGACQPPQYSSSATRSSYYDNPQYENYPVIYVDWNMAVSYCEWRNARLPTEAEWEKAARGTNGWAYPWGNIFDGNIVNFCDINCLETWANKNYNDKFSDTSPVGSFDKGKSSYGIYDMAGNVWEWVEDWYSETYYASSPTKSPTNTDSSGYRVIRGGSWYVSDESLISSARASQSPSLVSYYLGFRCARSENP